MTKLTVTEYLELVDDARKEQGAIAGQRSVLATTTAKRIRERMVADLVAGALLPPLVLGLVVSSSDYASISSSQTAESVLGRVAAGKQLSIIDGMQRTGALAEAVSREDRVGEHEIRVEFWLADNVRAMIYRMLVLNTGQVPWTMSRQLTVVYAPLLQEITQKVPALARLHTPDKPGRRVAAAQYSSDQIVELYIAFSLRKSAIDTREAVSDEFSRLDFVENVASADFQDQFYRTLQMLASLDLAFSAYDDGTGGPFSKGRNIFDRQPARIGYVVAIGLAVLGRPGAHRDAPERINRMVALEQSQASLIQRLSGMGPEELAEFLKLDVLGEVLDRRVGQVGRYERSVFSEGFKVLVEENFALPNMEPCWRAN